MGKIYDQTIGVSLDPKRIKAISAAETEVHHNVVVSQTEALLKADELAQRAGKRLLIKEIRRQNNIEKVILLTTGELDAVVADKPVGTDWATRYFDIVQDVTEEEVQKLWAKILAGGN